jgi:hypothetical protein
MNWLKNIFGGTTNPVASVVIDTAKGVADIVERWSPSDARSHEMYIEVEKLVSERVAAARASQQSAGTGVLHNITEFVNHMVAPALTVFVCGALFGYFPITTQTTDPLILSWGEAVGAYWLGARAITRDIPALIKMLVELKRGAR